MSHFNFNAREFLRNHAKYQNSVFYKVIWYFLLSYFDNKKFYLG